MLYFRENVYTLLVKVKIVFESVHFFWAAALTVIYGAVHRCSTVKAAGAVVLININFHFLH